MRPLLSSPWRYPLRWVGGNSRSSAGFLKKLAVCVILGSTQDPEPRVSSSLALGPGVRGDDDGGARAILPRKGEVAGTCQTEGAVRKTLVPHPPPSVTFGDTSPLRGRIVKSCSRTSTVPQARRGPVLPTWPSTSATLRVTEFDTEIDRLDRRVEQVGGRTPGRLARADRFATASDSRSTGRCR